MSDRPIRCKVAACGWDTNGTARGATSCTTRGHEDCLFDVATTDLPGDDECGHDADARLAAYAGQTVEDEWRVTGDPGNGYPPYEFISAGPDAEVKARNFVSLVGDRWTTGPFLHHRTVTRSPWEEA